MDDSWAGARQNWRKSAVLTLARGLRSGQGMSMETAVGRWLAFAAHPCAAWRLRPETRALLLGTYFAAGYLGTLLLLVARN